MRPLDRLWPEDSPFPPIADYGFLSDCHTGALVASDGSVEWLCLPHFDSPSVFAAMLDRGAGRFRVGPYGLYVPAGRRYLPGTNVIETTWMTPQGWVRVVDALTIGEWHDNEEGSSHTRPPTDYDADHLLVRVIECMQGAGADGDGVRADARLRRDDGEVERGGGGLTAGRGGPPPPGARRRTDGATVFRLFSDMRVGIEGNRVHARHTLQPKARSASARCRGRRGWAGPRTVEQAGAHLERTNHFWRTWLAEGTYPDHPWRPHLQRSALALKGLTFMPTGALVAAATTSLPETPQGVAQLGLPLLLDARRDVHAVGAARAGPGLGGGRLRAVPRGPGAQRGRVAADHVWDQGEQGSGGAHARSPQGLRERAPGEGRQRGLQPAPERRVRGGAGLGVPALQETRPHPRAAVAGADRPGALRRAGVARARPGHLGGAGGAAPLRLLEADVLGGDGPGRAPGRTARGGRARAATARRLADEIKAEILEKGVDKRGVFRQHYDTDALDASNLLIPLVRFLPPSDERVCATVRAIKEELTENGLVLRYRTDETDDGQSGEEGTFLICSFWLVSALAEIGELPRGRTPVRAPAHVRLAAAAVRGGAGGLLGAPAGQLPAGVHAPRADQRGDARDRGAAGGLGRPWPARCCVLDRSCAEHTSLTASLPRLPRNALVGVVQ